MSSRWRLPDRRVHSSISRKCQSISPTTTSVRFHRELVPAGPHAAGVLFSCHGWSRRAYRYGPKDCRNRIHQVKAWKNAMGLLRWNGSQLARRPDSICLWRGWDGWRVHRTAELSRQCGGSCIGVSQVGLDRQLLGDQAKFDRFAHPVEDCRLLGEFIFPCTDPSQPHYLLINMHRIVQNAIQPQYYGRKPSDLDPAYTVDTVQELAQRLPVVVRGDHPLESQKTPP
jgi:hypothetical protein